MRKSGFTEERIIAILTEQERGIQTQCGQPYFIETRSDYSLGLNLDIERFLSVAANIT